MLIFHEIAYNKIIKSCYEDLIQNNIEWHSWSGSSFLLLHLPLYTLFWNSLYLSSMKLPYVIVFLLYSLSSLWFSPTPQSWFPTHRFSLSTTDCFSSLFVIMSAHLLGSKSGLYTDLKFYISNNLNLFSSWAQEIWNEMPKVDYTVRGDRMCPIIEDFHSYIEPSLGKMT